MFEYNRDEFVKEAEDSFKLYGFNRIKASDINVLVDSDFFSLSYRVDNEYTFSVSYSGDNSATRFTSSLTCNAVSFDRNYDIDNLERDKEDVYSYILNFEGYYGNELVSKFSDLKGYEGFSQCLSDILLSLLGYADK